MPPVLVDLGLGPALAYLVTSANERDPDGRVVDELDDLTEHDPGSRPPADVELAIFRIVQEALRNALVHSRAHAIVVEGLVGVDQVEVAVRDDGAASRPTPSPPPNGAVIWAWAPCASARQGSARPCRLMVARGRPSG